MIVDQRPQWWNRIKIMMKIKDIKPAVEQRR
jgi:hypothetical protein